MATISVIIKKRCFFTITVKV